MKKTQKRESNFDCMGIILMQMVVILHVLLDNNNLRTVGSIEYYVYSLMRSFCAVAVNVFVIRTGYFGTELKWKKLAKIELRTCVYAWGGTALTVLIGMRTLNLRQDVQILFPVITRKYWYITVYMVLCILSPYINTFLKATDEKSLRKFLIAGSILFYGVATFSYLLNADQIVPDCGYGIVNFTYLYCLGYYIRHFYQDKYGSKKYAIVYFIASVFIFAVNGFMSMLMGFYFDSMISYNTIFVLAGAFGFFMMFKNIHIRRNRIINALASKTLAVYLCHMIVLRTLLYYLGKSLFDLPLKEVLFFSVVLPQIVYVFCYCIDCGLDVIIRPLENKIDCLLSAPKKNANP